MQLGKVLCVLLLICCSGMISAENQLKGMRVWQSPESTRVVFDIDKGIEYKVYTMHSPERVVIDLINTRLNTDISKVPLKNTGIKKLRSGSHAQNMLRIVLDLDHKVNINTFVLEPNARYGERLVIDLEADNKQAILALFDLDAKTKVPLPQDFVIAIDPGHGGEDPGAIGPRGTREKDIALAISKRLKDLINSQPGMQAFLIRNGDYYLGFRERMKRARSKNADLFISVHADSFVNSKADGASVFVLSTSKASSVAARWLVASENRADLMGGVSLRDKPNDLAAVMFDLTQTANFAASMEASQHILKQMGKTTKLHKNRVEGGPFLVLRSPDIPSLLVETGFISNHKTELLLRDHKHQEKIAYAIAQGIKEYFKNKSRIGAAHK